MLLQDVRVFHRGLCVLALVAATGCGRRDDVQLALAVGEDVRSLIIGVELGDDVELRALDLGPDARGELEVLEQYVGAYDVRVTVVEHTAPLETLRLLPGVLAFVEDGVPIPTASGRIMATTVRGDTREPWTEQEALSPALAAYRIEGSRDDECITRGGCFDTNASGGTVCINPCPAPEESAIEAARVATLPQFGECPAGWTASDLGRGINVCTPFPTGPPACAGSTASFPGEAGCRLVGRACPAGEWPEGLSGDVLYVRAGASGGTGTRTDPFGDIEDASNASSGGETIALGKGTHLGRISLKTDVTLMGACASETALDSTASTSAAVTVDDVPRVTVRDLLVRSRGDGLRVHGDKTGVTVDGVVIVDSDGFAGLNVFGGARVLGRDLLIGPMPTRGLRAGSDSSVTIEGLVLNRVSRLGVYVSNDAAAILRNVAVIDTQPDVDNGTFGRAFNVESSGSLTVERGYARAAHELSVFVSGRDTRFVMSDGVLEDTRRRASDDAGGDAIQVLGGATMALDRVWIDRSASEHLYVSTGSALVTTATLTDVVMTNAAGPSASDDGHAVRGFGTSDIHLVRTAIDTTYGTAILVKDESMLDLEDVTIANAGSTRGSGAMSSVRAEDAAVVLANGVNVYGGTGKALHFENRTRGVVEDIVVRDVGAGSCLVCSGLCGHNGGTITGTRIDIEGAAGRAINASDALTDIAISHVRVAASPPAPSCTVGTRSPLLGDGVGVVDGGRLEIDYFVVERNPNAGLVVENYLGVGGEQFGLIASDGIVRQNMIGANVFVADYPLVRVANRVKYVDNESALNR